VPELNRLYRAYQDRAAFFVVYIQEAHPIDGWQMPANVTEHVLFASTKTADERDAVAEVCMTKLAIEMPALVDEADDRVERADTAWPERMYVIGADGTIAYKSDAGPFGFKPAEVETALQRIIPAQVPFAS